MVIGIAISHVKGKIHIIIAAAARIIKKAIKISRKAPKKACSAIYVPSVVNNDVVSVAWTRPIIAFILIIINCILTNIFIIRFITLATILITFFRIVLNKLRIACTASTNTAKNSLTAFTRH